MNRQLRNLTFAVATAAILATPAGAADWPWFRGPDHDGVSKETGLLDSWPEGGPKVLWRKPLGGGYSAISVVGGRLYTMFDDGDETFVAAFDASTGEEVWRFAAGKAFENSHGDGPRSTPTVEDGVVYAYTARGTLVALDAGEGIVKWTRNLKEDYDAKVPQWGISSSPVVEDGFLLVEVGGSKALMMAFNKKNGREVWRAGKGKAGYSTPLVITVNGVTQVVFFAGEAIYSVTLRSGELLWEQPWKTSWDVNAAMPIFVEPDLLFISSGYDTGAAMFRISGEAGSAKATEVWRNRDMKNQFSTSVYHDGHLYGFDNKIFKCIDAETGEMKWRARDLGHGSLIYADGKLIVLGEQGQLVLAKATPEAYTEISRTQIFESKTWTAPSLSGGKLYLRDESEIVAIDISG